MNLEHVGAYDRAISATFHAVGALVRHPADHTAVLQAMVARILVETIRSLGLAARGLG